MADQGHRLSGNGTTRHGSEHVMAGRLQPSPVIVTGAKWNRNVKGKNVDRISGRFLVKHGNVDCILKRFSVRGKNVDRILQLLLLLLS